MSTESPRFVSIVSSRHNSQVREIRGLNIEELEFANAKNPLFRILKDKRSNRLVSFNKHESDTSLSTDKKSSEAGKMSLGTP